MDEVLRIYSKNLSTAETEKQLIDAYREINNRIINVDSESEASLYESSQATGTMPERIGHGKFRRDFAKIYTKKFEADFGRNGSKFRGMTPKVSWMSFVSRHVNSA